MTDEVLILKLILKDVDDLYQQLWWIELGMWTLIALSIPAAIGCLAAALKYLNEG